MTTALLVAYLVVAYIVGRGAVLGLVRDGWQLRDGTDIAGAFIIGIAVGLSWPLALIALGAFLWVSAEADKEL